jgi:hypothetical protein
MILMPKKGYHLAYSNNRALAEDAMRFPNSGYMFFRDLTEASRRIGRNWVSVTRLDLNHREIHICLSEKGLASISSDNDIPSIVRLIKLATLREEALEEIAQELGLPYDRKHVLVADSTLNGL